MIASRHHPQDWRQRRRADAAGKGWGSNFEEREAGEREGS